MHITFNTGSAFDKYSIFDRLRPNKSQTENAFFEKILCPVSLNLT